MNGQFLRMVKPGAGRLAVALLAVVIAALSLALVGIRSGAGAGEVRFTKTVELGRSGKLPNAACPKDCQVVASVSGFQVREPQSNSPFVAPFNGRITHFTLYLGKPSREDRRLLRDRFGSPPQAAIAVLRKVRDSAGREKFKLLRRSPVEGLSKYLGTRERIKLSSPLRVRKRNFVALSVPTWAPVFAPTQNRGSNRWRASRQPRKCGAGSVNQSSPQLKPNSSRLYGCRFTGSRLLYTATLVPDSANSGQ